MTLGLDCSASLYPGRRAGKCSLRYEMDFASLCPRSDHDEVEQPASRTLLVNAVRAANPAYLRPQVNTDVPSGSSARIRMKVQNPPRALNDSQLRLLQLRDRGHDSLGGALIALFAVVGIVVLRRL